MLRQVNWGPFVTAPRTVGNLFTFVYPTGYLYNALHCISKCHVCGKATWAGCGQHVQRTVSAAQWYVGPRTLKQRETADRQRGGFFACLLGRRN